MYKQTNKIVDSFSANQLMQALSTLKNMSNPHHQFQVSFNKEQISKPNGLISFSKNQNHHAHKHNHYFNDVQRPSNHKSNRKNSQSSKISPSPLREHINNHQSKKSGIQSRSLSPFDRKTQKTFSRVTNFTKYTQSHKQNKKQFEPQGVYPSSHQTKKILNQREKNGVNYIPIQHRAEDLLKQKQRKIAKMKKQKEFSKILQEKECTFKPQIKPYYKKTKLEEKPLQFEKQQSQRISDFQKQRFQECFIDEDFIGELRPFKDHNFLQETLYSQKPSEQPQRESRNKQYKNQKFNILLDLIQ